MKNKVLLKKPLAMINRYRVGSVTKMFTAAMLLQLVAEGRIKLTDTLNKFFPQIPNANKITIDQILRHRSGIHDKKARIERAGIVIEFDVTNKQMLLKRNDRERMLTKDN